MHGELARVSIARQEEFDLLFIKEVMRTFGELNYSFNEAMQRIKLCKVKKRYGNKTTMQDFTDVDLSEYPKFYSEEYGMVSFKCQKCGYESSPVKETTDFNFRSFRHEADNCGGVCKWERQKWNS